MTNQATNLANFFSTTLSSGVGSGDLTFNVTTTVGGPASPCYIVIDPETPANREVILCDGSFSSTQFATTTLGNRDLDTNGNLVHLSGVTVWVAAVAQHFDDLNDRIDAALALAGGTMTGTLAMADQEVTRAKLRDYAETVNVVAASGTTQTLDCETANVHRVTLTGNCVFTFSNPPATGVAGTLAVRLIQDGTGSRTATWPGSVVWPGGVTPTLSTDAAAIDFLTFYTDDGGTTWLGFVGGRDFS